MEICLNRNSGNVVWGGSVGAIFLTRDLPNSYAFSYDSDPTREHIQLLNVRDTIDEWTPGTELRLSRFDVCSQVGWELAYWQLFTGSGSARVNGADMLGNLDAILEYDQVNYPGTTTLGSAYTDNAAYHTLSSSWEFLNVEANRYHVASNPSPCGSGWTVSCSPASAIFASTKIMCIR